MTSQEGECKGGEFAFFQGLYRESKLFRGQVRMFSCMVGVKSHFEETKSFLIDRLQEKEIMRVQMVKLE